MLAEVARSASTCTSASSNRAGPCAAGLRHRIGKSGEPIEIGSPKSPGPVLTRASVLGALVSTAVVLALPAIAAGANTIVYQHGGDIWSSNDAGIDALQITPSAGTWRWRFDPTLSLDGTVVYAAQADGAGGLQEELVKTSVSGGEETVIYSRPEDYIEGPRFSPDGHTVIFDRFGLGTNGFDLYALDLHAPQLPPVPISTLPGDETPAAFSPDGSEIAFGYGHSLEIANADGSSRRAINPPGVYYASRPYFSPDGRTLVFQATPSPSGGQYDIYTINTDGSGLRRLTTSAVTDENPQWSPDSQTIVFQRGRYGNDPDIYAVAPDGTSERPVLADPTWLEAYPAYQVGRGPTISGIPREGETLTVATNGWPDGAQPAGYAYEWRRCDAVGGNCTGINGASGSAYMATVVDVGSTLRVRVAAIISATDIRTVDTPATAEIVGLPSSTLAAAFRPVLQFDSSEVWRPLNLSAFFAETDPGTGQPFHHVCAAAGSPCSGITDVSQVTSYPGGWLQVGNISPSGEHVPSDYKSPNPSCTAGSLMDCDTGPSAGIYFHVTSSASYDYLSYWAFYRYNNFSFDQHEGDWEGMNVAVNHASPRAFDAAGFDKHGTIEWEIRNPWDMECDAGGTGSCGIVADGSGPKRIWAYVARGSHASYPQKCTNSVIPPSICWNAEGIPEGNHDGRANWGANSDPAALIGTPEPGGGSWVDWPGHWGATCAPAFTCTFPSPKSPGNQKRFQCGGYNYQADPQACPSRARGRRAVAPLRCRDWFGASIVALACSPSMVRHALRTGTLGRRAPFTIRLLNRVNRVVRANGVVQAFGRPLRKRDTAEIRGRLPRDIQLLVRARLGHEQIEGRFAGRALSSHRRATVQIDGHDLVARSGGKLIRPIATKRIRLP